MTDSAFRLGVLTIGQAPRTDLTPEIAPLLPGVSLIEAGVLDGLEYGGILAEGAPKPGEHALTTRLADGRSVVVGEDFVMDRMPQRLAELESRCDAVLLACTGPFPDLPHRRPLVAPDRVITHMTAGLAPSGSTIGVVSPLPEQQEDTTGKFQRRIPGSGIITTSASPYTSPLEEFTAAGRELRGRGARIIALDCIGYTEDHRRTVAEAAGVPVVLARSAAARFAMEVLASMTPSPEGAAG